MTYKKFGSEITFNEKFYDNRGFSFFQNEIVDPDDQAQTHNLN